MPTPSVQRALLACLVVAALAGDARPQGGGWMQRPELLDADGSIFDLLVFDGELIAAGDFEHIGGVEAGGLAAFDGARWRALDDPLRMPMDGGNPVNAWAEVLAEFENDLIVGGRFLFVGDQLAPFVARWDGSELRSLSQGANRRVASLAVHDKDLIVGGYFTAVDGIPAERVARFRSSFEAMDNGFAAGVTALASFEGRLWAGGLFSQSGTRSTPRVAYWADGAWISSSPGFDTNDDDPPAVFAFSVVDERLYALGHFHQSGTQRTNGMARWDGASWVSFAGGLGGDGEIFWANELVRYGDDLYVAGRFARAGGVPASNVARYDGATWSPLSLGTDDEVKALAVFEGELYVAGIFSRAGGASAQRLAVWKTAQTPKPRGELALTVFPSPVRDRATLRVALPRPGRVEFRISDLRGRLLRRWTVELSSISAETPLDIERAPVASGRYLLTMRAGDDEITRSFVIQR